MDAESLLVKKVQLNREGLLDPVLKTNLKFAIAAMEVLPTAMKRNTELLVEGDQMVLKFYTHDQPKLKFTVFQDLEGPKLHQKITVGQTLNRSDIKEAYFIGHSCPQDEPCRNQWSFSLVCLTHNSCAVSSVSVYGNSCTVSIVLVYGNCNALTFDVRPDTQGILSVKLKQKNCQDYNLLSALDLAERTFRNNPLSRDISLVVVGDCQCVRIGEADDIIYTVTGEQGHGRVDGCVYCDGVVSKSDVKSIHFSMHSCQNEVKSCFVEATEAAQDENVEALKSPATGSQSSTPLGAHQRRS
ncbi:hypothetical protein NFI96_000848 [Prochilodus magdalenae]|nr:hypothetical protein NFI96_000848 [Prochilodus magdalenae]